MVRMRLQPLRSLASLAFAATLAACAADAEPGSSSDDILAKKPAVSKEVAELFDAVDESCSGNNNGWLRTYDVTTFKASEAMARLREEDKDAMGVACVSQHAYSKSRESGVAAFLDHIGGKGDEWSHETKSCLDDNLTSAQRDKLAALISDPENLGVFASTFADGDNSEGCAYYSFHVYRRDGVLLEFTFNYTD